MCPCEAGVDAGCLSLLLSRDDLSLSLELAVFLGSSCLYPSTNTVITGTHPTRSSAWALGNAVHSRFVTPEPSPQPVPVDRLCSCRRNFSYFPNNYHLIVGHIRMCNASQI